VTEQKKTTDCHQITMKKAVIGTLLALASVEGFTISKPSFNAIQGQSRSVFSAASSFRPLPSTILSETVEGAAEDAGAPALKVEDLVVGEKYKGVVNNLVTYGAFVDIGCGINGLVHVSQISDTFVRRADEVVSVGQEVEVKLLEVDSENSKLVLSMRTQERPAEKVKQDVGHYSKMVESQEFISGVVEDTVSYGAFVKLEDGVTAFLHISQLKPDRVQDVTDVINAGDAVQVRVIEVDEEKRRVSLSLLQPGEKEAALNAKPTTQDVSAWASKGPEMFQAEVTGLTDFGVFMEADGIKGLLHISQIGERRTTIEEMKSLYRVGESYPVRVMELRPDEGKAFLSAKAPASNFAARSPEEVFSGKVASVNSWALFVDIGGFEAMLHVSEMVGKEPEAYAVGEAIDVRIMEVNTEENQVRLTQCAVGEEGTGVGRKQKQGGGGRQGKADVSAFADADPKAFISGKVVSVTDFGAFVEIAPGVDGLCHISQLGKGGRRVESVADAVAVGDEVQVRVISADLEAGNVELSMRDAPKERQPNGDVSAFAGADAAKFIPGTVNGMIGSGLFVTVAEGVDAWCHVSQAGGKGRVNDIYSEFSMGQEVQVRVTGCDVEARKVEVSMKPFRVQGAGGFGDDLEVPAAENEPDWKKYVSGGGDSGLDLSINSL